ncbi:MAG: hypothetical protein L3J63_12045, partial [Geopsychrobacter sp.]|nr:hypothetical protein [Geopsychrobacter sp.]
MDNIWRVLKFLVPLFIVIFLGAAGISSAAQKGKLSGLHGDRTIMPKSCRACHRGMKMSISGEEENCL